MRLMNTSANDKRGRIPNHIRQRNTWSTRDTRGETTSLVSRIKGSLIYPCSDLTLSHFVPYGWFIIFPRLFFSTSASPVPAYRSNFRWGTKFVHLIHVYKK